VYILTAHPTEATRRTALQIQSRISEVLLEGHGDEGRRAANLEAEVELLWLTAEVRQDRPSVMDEVSTTLWYMEDRFMDAGAQVTEGIRDAFEEAFATPLTTPPRIRPGSWVAGDRDGNPFVTPETTLAATRRATHRVLGHYHGQVRRLAKALSLSTRITGPVPQSLSASLVADRLALPQVWEANAKRDRDEPIRLKLSFMAARLEGSRAWVASRDAGKPQIIPYAYATAEPFMADLQLLHEALLQAKATMCVKRHLQPLMDKVYAHGFFGLKLDLREDSEVLKQTLADVLSAIGMDPLDRQGLTR